MKRILALVLGLAMLSALASGCAPTGESGGGQSSPAVNTGSNTSYTIATNNFGAGVYPLDTNAAYEQNAADALGVTLNVTNNEFTADKSITQLQNQLAHDRRIIGFTEAFEAGGGEVLFVSHSADPSEGVQKTNDLLTAYPDVDCVYACGNDYVAPAADVVKSRGLEGCKIYGADISPNICQLIMDGEVEACSGGVFASCGVAITLLVNYLDGNVIKDSEGKAPYFDSLELFTVTSDNAEDFYKFLSDEALSTHTISDEEYQNLLVRNNAEVNYDYYVDFMANYAENVYAKVEANANRA